MSDPIYILVILTIAFLYVIVLSYFTHKSLKSIELTLDDIQIHRFNKLMSKAENLNSSFCSKYNDLSSNINSAKISIVDECKDMKTNINSAKTAIVAECKDIKSNLTIQSKDLISSLNEHYQILSAIRENLKLIKQLIKTNNQNVVSKLEDTNLIINSITDDVSSAIYNSYNSLNSSIEINRTSIKDNENAINKMNSSLVNCLGKFSHIEELYRNLQLLYKKILEEESKISKQEQSLTNMVSRHAQIFEITNELNKTSIEIFEFMKLYLIQSTFDKLNK